MRVLLLAGILIILALIAFQDFRTKSFNVFLAPLLFSLSLIAKIYAESFYLVEWFINLMIVAFLFFGTAYYIKWRRKINWQGFFNDYFGIGDLLFWLAISPLFQPFHYILLLSLSFVFAFIFNYIYCLLRKKDGFIPLAAYQSLFYIVYILIVELVLQKSLFVFNPDFFHI